MCSWITCQQLELTPKQFEKKTRRKPIIIGNLKITVGLSNNLILFLIRQVCLCASQWCLWSGVQCGCVSCSCGSRMLKASLLNLVQNCSVCASEPILKRCNPMWLISVIINAPVGSFEFCLERVCCCCCCSVPQLNTEGHPVCAPTPVHVQVQVQSIGWEDCVCNRFQLPHRVVIHTRSSEDFISLSGEWDLLYNMWS